MGASGAKAVVLLSGGLDSATTLAIARAQGHACYTLALDYGQRHYAELDAAQRISGAMGAQQHKVVQVDLRSIGGSALTDTRIDVPTTPSAGGIPITYVPARNTIILALALGWAEVLQAWNIYIGVNAVDYSGYPDCRPEFIAAFQTLAQLATKAGVEGQRFAVHAPLVRMTKAEIILRGIELGVDYSTTVSCYNADAEGRACRQCESCRLRAQGFSDAGVADVTQYI